MAGGPRLQYVPDVSTADDCLGLRQSIGLREAIRVRLRGIAEIARYLTETRFASPCRLGFDRKPVITSATKSSIGLVSPGYTPIQNTLFITKSEFGKGPATRDSQPS